MAWFSLLHWQFTAGASAESERKPTQDAQKRPSQLHGPHYRASEYFSPNESTGKYFLILFATQFKSQPPLIFLSRGNAMVLGKSGPLASKPGNTCWNFYVLEIFYQQLGNIFWRVSVVVLNCFLQRREGGNVQNAQSFSYHGQKLNTLVILNDPTTTMVMAPYRLDSYNLLVMQPR